MPLVLRTVPPVVRALVSAPSRLVASIVRSTIVRAGKFVFVRLTVAKHYLQVARTAIASRPRIRAVFAKSKKVSCG